MAIDVYGAPVPRPGKLYHFGEFCISVLRLIVPSVGLSIIYIACFYLLQVSAGISLETANTIANPAWWMTMGHLGLAVAFFAVALTNRAHGPAMAMGQVVLSWILIGAILGFAVYTYGLNTILEELFPTKIMGAFVLALFAAHLVGIGLFDMQRGMLWWKAPLAGAIGAPLIFVLIFYPFSHVGMDAPWLSWMWMDFVAKAAMGVLLLVPYNMLRRMVRPAPGLSGR